MTHRIGKPQYSSKELLQPEQLSELVHKLGHEIDNPLTAVISLAAVIGRIDDKSPEQLREKLRQYGSAIASESWRVSQLIGSLVMLCSQKHHLSELSIGRTIRQASNRVRDREKFDKIPLTTSFNESEDKLFFDGSKLQSIVAETLLLIHELATEDGVAAKDPQLSFEVSKLGTSLTLCGSCNLIKPLNFALDDLFRPFALRNQELRALGLSPAIIWAVVEKLNGQVVAEEMPLESGVRFSLRIKLPLEAEPANATKPRQPAVVTSSATSIAALIIDDEDLISDSLKKIITLSFAALEKVECRCSRGADVLSLLAAGFNPNVIICDMNLVHTSGRHIYQSVAANYPALAAKFIFLTGDPDNPEIKQFLQDSAAPCMKKPFDAGEIVAIIRQQIEK